MKAITLESDQELAGSHNYQLIPELLPYHSIWKSFKSGMDALYRYAHRSEVDPSQIARANLKLLHRTLLSEPLYRNILRKKSNSDFNNGLISTLLDTPDLTARLILVKENTRPELLISANYLDIALMISGRMIVSDTKNNTINSVSQRNYSRFDWNNNAIAQHSKKEGDIIVFNARNEGTNSSLLAEKDSVLLHIQLRTQSS